MAGQIYSKPGRIVPPKTCNADCKDKHKMYEV